MKKILFGVFGHPRKVSHLRHFWVFRSQQKLYIPYLHGFEKSLNNQGIIRKHTVKIHILVVPIFFLNFFWLFKKVQLFKVPFRGTWLRRENLEIHTYNSHGNWFYMYLMSISTLLYVESPCSDYLDLHPNGQKTRFLPFSIRSIFLG
jgi:hypothetical protein